MSYESPIEMVMGQMHMEVEGKIYKAVQDIGVNIDREELLKALRYDRRQYGKGYADRDAEIVRCKDCKWLKWADADDEVVYCKLYNISHEMNWFCADGRRMAENEERY